MPHAAPHPPPDTANAKRLQEFRSFPLQSIEEMTHNVRRFRVGLPSDEHVMGMSTASCIVVKGKGKDGSVAVRPYTPTTTNDTKVCLCRRAFLWCVSVCVCVFYFVVLVRVFSLEIPQRWL